MQPTLKCPHCKEEIDSLNYNSSVDEQGYIEIKYSERTERIYEDNQEVTDSNTQETDKNCPHCSHSLEIEDIIIEKQQTTNTAKQTKFSVGDKVIIIADNVHHNHPTGTELTISRITNGEFYSPNSRSYFTKNDIKLKEKRTTIDKGESETFDIIKSKEEADGYKLDPMLKYGAICPKCKILFIDGEKDKYTPENIEIKKGKYINTTNQKSICPNCTYVFDKAKTFNKLINKQKCQN